MARCTAGWSGDDSVWGTAVTASSVGSAVSAAAMARWSESAGVDTGAIGAPIGGGSPKISHISAGNGPMGVSTNGAEAAAGSFAGAAAVDRWAMGESAAGAGRLGTVPGRGRRGKCSSIEESDIRPACTFPNFARTRASSCSGRIGPVKAVGSGCCGVEGTAVGGAGSRRTGQTASRGRRPGGAAAGWPLSAAATARARVSEGDGETAGGGSGAAVSADWRALCRWTIDSKRRHSGQSSSLAG